MSDPEPPRRPRARPDLKNLYDALQPSEVARAKVVENVVGMAFVLIPAVGPLLVAGPLVAALVGALEGAVVGGSAGALGAALVSLGVPENSVLEYETKIRTGKYMLLVHGSVAEVEEARGILGLAAAVGV